MFCVHVIVLDPSRKGSQDLSVDLSQLIISVMICIFMIFIYTHNDTVLLLLLFCLILALQLLKQFTLNLKLLQDSYFVSLDKGVC